MKISQLVIELWGEQESKLLKLSIKTINEPLLWNEKMEINYNCTLHFILTWYTFL